MLYNCIYEISGRGKAAVYTNTLEGIQKHTGIYYKGFLNMQPSEVYHIDGYRIKCIALDTTDDNNDKEMWR